jgi:hypothetical protein
VRKSLQVIVDGLSVVVTVAGGMELLALAEYAGAPPTLMAAMKLLLPTCGPSKAEMSLHWLVEVS